MEVRALRVGSLAIWVINRCIYLVYFGGLMISKNVIGVRLISLKRNVQIAHQLLFWLCFTRALPGVFIKAKPVTKLTYRIEISHTESFSCKCYEALQTGPGGLWASTNALNSTFFKAFCSPYKTSLVWVCAGRCPILPIFGYNQGWLWSNKRLSRPLTNALAFVYKLVHSTKILFGASSFCWRLRETRLGKFSLSLYK